MATYLLDPEVCFLNHGSFGATPKELLDAQHALRLEMEAEPVDFLARTLPDRWNVAIDAVADFLGADREGTVFVPNATSGINAVIASVDWARGDEILTINHRYDAVRRTLDHAAARFGVSVVEAQVPFPLHSPEQVTAAVTASLSEKTRMLVIDQITSPTALITPVQALVDLARERGILVLVDGAHAPGHIDVNLDQLSPDFWVGNLHKWLCAPKGAAVLYVAEPWRSIVHPNSISHGYGQGLHAEFSWTGTHDPTAFLCAPAAIALHEAQGGAAFRAAHHALVQTGRTVIATALGVTLPHPDRADLYGAMATIPLPCTASDVPDLFEAIRHEDHIEVPILVWDDRAWVRISGFAGTNTPDQYHRLAQALAKRLRGA
jgi:isopenicillin-N epimerase